MKHIITADDYGISPIIDDAINKAIAKGCVTSVAGFANGKDEQGNFSVQKLKRLKESFPQVSVGLHFTLTSGQAVSGNPKSLTRKRGRYFKSMRKQNPKYLDLLELESELKAQITVFDKAGLEIQHFSDHVGILTLTKRTAGVYYKVAKEYSDRIGKPVPLRNPMLLAALIDQGCLDKSVMFKLGRFGSKVLHGIKLDLDSMKLRLQEMQQKGLPTADYFIEHLYKCPERSTITCIFNDTPNVKQDSVVNRISDEPISEIVTHLAEKPNDHENNENYKKEIRKLQNHKGISINYLKGKRHMEYEMLLTELPGMIPSVDVIAYPRAR